MSTARYLVGLLLLVTLCWARAEMWTNQAGRVVEARLQSFDGVSVTLVKTNAQTLQIPLASLCAADQRRVRQQAGLSIAPEFVQAAYRDASAVLARFDSQPASRKTGEGRTKAALMACSVFDARMGVRAQEITDQAVRDEIKRLRSLLADQGK
jgi:hypothetical protein